ncbi:MAG: restriction endonuclease subunit S [Candidatus Aminicenantales bacterium]
MTDRTQVPTAAASGRFRPYPSYKVSDLGRLRKIPTHWQAMNLKIICQLAYGYSLQSDERLEGDVGVFGSNGAVGFHNKANTLGPCLVIGRKGSFGKVNYSIKPVFAIDTTFFIDERFTNTDLRWLYYALTWLQLDATSKDSAIPGLDRQDAYACNLPVCPPEEQRRIACFLDFETARIDALIEKKERLIELLQEKRTALITQAVTKGLDPTVAMKDSGVEWLAQIPAHWNIEINKRLFKESDTRSDLGDEELLTVSHISGVTRHSEKNVTMIEAESYENYKICREGELAINTMWAWMGALGIAKEDGMVSPSYNVYLAKNRSLHPRYYDYLSRVPLHVAELTKHSKGIWKSRLRLYPDGFFEIYTPLPPVGEQECITDQLDSSVCKIAALLMTIRKALENLKEYRMALISAAVTGKIDVRAR